MTGDLTRLIIAQIVIDGLLVVTILTLLHRLKRGDKENGEVSRLDAIEDVLVEADRVAAAFKDQLSEKKELANNVVEMLDEKIIGLQMLLNRAEAVLESAQTAVDARQAETSAPPRRTILQMAEAGVDPAEIARQLSLSKEEVKLVLDVKRQTA
jgi:hypothetical protein